jgi:hypothetical protein
MREFLVEHEFGSDLQQFELLKNIEVKIGYIHCCSQKF